VPHFAKSSHTHQWYPPAALRATIEASGTSLTTCSRTKAKYLSSVQAKKWLAEHPREGGADDAPVLAGLLGCGFGLPQAEADSAGPESQGAKYAPCPECSKQACAHHQLAGGEADPLLSGPDVATQVAFATHGELAAKATLQGDLVVFAGQQSSGPKPARLGGKRGSSVTKATTMIVVGQRNPGKDADRQKLQRAKAIRTGGGKITFLTSAQYARWGQDRLAERSGAGPDAGAEDAPNP